jgi:hypothetical protein
MPWQNNNNDRLVETIRDMFNEQSVTLAQQSTSLAGQSQRLDQLTLQISTVVNQHEALRNDFNQRWADLPKVYIPRQEVIAMGHNERIIGLEEGNRKLQADIAELKLVLQQQLQQSVLATARDVAKVQLDGKADTLSQRAEIDGRTILLYSTAILALISIVVTIVLHFI